MGPSIPTGIPSNIQMVIIIAQAIIKTTVYGIISEMIATKPAIIKNSVVGCGSLFPTTYMESNTHENQFFLIINNLFY